MNRRLPAWLLVLGVAGAAFAVLPLVGLLLRAPWGRLGEAASGVGALTALRLSIVVSLVATVFALVLGVPLAWVLARLEFGETTSITRTALLDHSPYTKGNASWREYDVSRDGRRFIFTRSRSQARAAPPVMVLNWLSEVKQAMAARSPDR